MENIQDIADLILRYSKSCNEDRSSSLDYEWDAFWHARSKKDLMTNLLADYTQHLARLYQTQEDPKTRKFECFSEVGNEKLKELVEIINKDDILILKEYVKINTDEILDILGGRNTIHD
tara:strand:+ start:1386 stop:1742 length:357 start_codon:yes stop_codon:yes gene_type:complete